MAKISFKEKLQKLFGTQPSFDEDFFDEMSDVLIESDIGAKLAFELIDKLEKIGENGVRAELKSISVNEEAIDKIIEFVTITGTCNEVIEKLRGLGIEDEIFITGVNDEFIDFILRYIADANESIIENFI